jgi:hypothetical protein
MARQRPLSPEDLITACQRARDRILAQPYTTDLSRELERVDVVEDAAWAQLEPGKR